MLQKLKAQRDSLLSEIDDLAEQFQNINSRLDPDNTLSLMDARLMIRDQVQTKDIDSLKEIFGKHFDYVKFNRASEKTDEKLREDPEAFRARNLLLEREHLTRQNDHRPVKRHSRINDLER